MIDAAFTLLRSQLVAYIDSLGDGGDGDAEVKLANVATLESDNKPDFEPNIIMSLVNIEEEATLKNTPAAYRTLQGVSYRNPPVFLNLYMLVSAHYKDDYEKSLLRLSNVIQFFQSKNSFSISNAPFQEDALLLRESYTEMQLHLEMFSLSFEQINHLWGSLGGKQSPAVLYKIRLVRITENRTTGSGALIENIEGKDGTPFGS